MIDLSKLRMQEEKKMITVEVLVGGKHVGSIELERFDVDIDYDDDFESNLSMD